jgi:hypothetical protein
MMNKLSSDLLQKTPLVLIAVIIWKKLGGQSHQVELLLSG